MMSVAFFLLFAATCHCSTDTNYKDYNRDMLFSADQSIQAMSLPIYHRFESESVKKKAQAGSMVQAWQDILGPETKVHFPGVFEEDKHLIDQQLQSWKSGHIYEWYWRCSSDISKGMFFVGYSMLQPAHLCLHSVVTASVESVFDFKGMEWCDKPFWTNTITCKMRHVLGSKQPGFLVNPSICLARQEAKRIMSHGVCNASEAATRRKKQFDDICKRIYIDYKYEPTFD